MNPIEIFIVDDEPDVREALGQLVDLAGFTFQTFESPFEALPHISRDRAAIVISDIRMPKMDGLEFLQKIIAVDSSIPVILITGHGDVQTAVEAIKIGAHSFIEKPFDTDILMAQIERAAEARQLVLNNRVLRSALSDPERLKHIFIGASEPVVKLREQILDFAELDTPILIHGEIGTGKTLTARALHAAGHHAKHPIHIAACGGLSQEDLEKMLFSHADVLGLLVSPIPMTIILDDVEMLPKRLQLLLAGRLEELAEDDRPIKRLIAIATDLVETPLEPELYSHLSHLQIKLPSLRERRGDILMIFNKYYETYCRDYGRNIEQLDADAAMVLMTMHWPGNVRQIIKFSETMTSQESTQPLSKRIKETLDQDLPDEKYLQASLKAQVDSFEEMLIRNALKRHKGSISEVLKELTLPRRTLNEKMSRYGLSRADFT